MTGCRIAGVLLLVFMGASVADAQDDTFKSDSFKFLIKKPKHELFSWARPRPPVVCTTTKKTSNGDPGFLQISVQAYIKSARQNVKSVDDIVKDLHKSLTDQIKDPTKNKVKQVASTSLRAR